MNLSEINTATLEGRLLIVAFSKLTTTVYSETEPDVVLQILIDGAEKAFPNALPSLQSVSKTTFEQDIEGSINKHSKENDSNTPDFILAKYLSKCLEAFNECSRSREKWYGKELKII